MHGPTRLAPTRLAIIVLLGLPTVGVSAEGSNAERILKDAWGARPEHQKLADTIYLSDRYSDETAYAYVLTLIRQHRFDRAKKVVDQLLERKPAHVDAWETRIWMKVARREFRSAIPDLTQMVSNIPKDDPRRLFRLAKAGRLLGFVDVSLNTADAELVLLEATEKIRRAVPATDWDLFNAQRNRVHDRFSDMIRMRDNTVGELDAAFQEDKKQQLAEINEDRKSMRTQLDDLDEQSKTLRDDLQQGLAELERADQPLRQQLMSLDSIAASVSRELSRVESRIYYLEHRLCYEEDSYARRWISNDLRRLESLARQYDRDLTELDVRASGVYAERNQLRSGAGFQLGSLQNDLDNARREGSRVRDDIKHASNIEKKLKKSKGPAAKAGWRLTLRARTLGTFYDFSPEVLRGQLLEDLAAKKAK